MWDVLTHDTVANALRLGHFRALAMECAPKSISPVSGAKRANVPREIVELSWATVPATITLTSEHGDPSNANQESVSFG